MTVLSQVPISSPVAGNGVNTLWAYGFRADFITDLRIKLTKISDQTIQYFYTNFTATGLGTLGGGIVTYPDVGTPVPATHTVEVERVVPYLQDVSISQQGGFHPAVIEQAMDRLEMQLQQAFQTPIMAQSLITSIIAVAAAVAINAAAAAASSASAAAALDQFTDLYLGPFAAAPLLDNDGNPLQIGAVYFDTVLQVLRVYKGAAVWLNVGTAINITIPVNTIVQAIDNDNVARIMATMLST